MVPCPNRGGFDLMLGGEGGCWCDCCGWWSGGVISISIRGGCGGRVDFVVVVVVVLID